MFALEYFSGGIKIIIVVEKCSSSFIWEHWNYNWFRCIRCC